MVERGICRKGNIQKSKSLIVGVLENGYLKLRNQLNKNKMEIKPNFEGQAQEAPAEMTKAITNEHGEKINVRVIGTEISIHHEDCSDEFIPISEFLCTFIISQDELVKIYSLIQYICIQKNIGGLSTKDAELKKEWEKDELLN